MSLINLYKKRDSFIYLFCHDFRKINSRIKIFEKCTSGVVPLLPPCPTALSPCRRGARRQEPGSGDRAGRRQDPGAERQVPTAVPHDVRVFLFFFVFHF
jgi:hypothetical protein